MTFDFPIHPPLSAAPDETEQKGSVFAPSIVLLGAVAVAILLYAGTPSTVGAIVVGLPLLMLTILSPRPAVLTTLVFLALMGHFRRLLIHDAGANDPVLLIGPAAALTLVAVAYLNGRLRADSRIARLVQILMVVMLLQIFNPLQGGVAVGAAGAMFYLVPLLWFWIGRAWGTSQFTEAVLFRTAVPLAVAAALLGLHQAFMGLMPFENASMREQYGNVLLEMGVNLRPFAFFVSTAEYASYLALTSAACMGTLFAGKFRLAIVALPLLLFAVFMSGCRGPIVAVVGTVIMMWALRSRTRTTAVVRGSIAAAVVFGGLYLTLLQVNNGPAADGAVGKLMSHQAKGLLDPSHSTASVHSDLLTGGVLAGFRNPLGLGLGSTTLAAGKFGGQAASSETDVGDAFLSLGVVGGVLYLLLAYSIVRTVIVHYRRTRSALALALMGFIVAGCGRWLLGQCYALAALTWFLIGAMDRIAARDLAGAAAPRPGANTSSLGRISDGQRFWQADQQAAVGQLH
jgi:hypothetical protein